MIHVVYLNFQFIIFCNITKAKVTSSYRTRCTYGKLSPILSVFKMCFPAFFAVKKLLISSVLDEGYSRHICCNYVKLYQSIRLFVYLLVITPRSCALSAPENLQTIRLVTSASVIAKSIDTSCG